MPIIGTLYYNDNILLLYHNVMNLINFIWQFVRQQRWTFAIVLFLSLLWSFEMLLWPFFLSKIVDFLTRYNADRFSALSSL